MKRRNVELGKIRRPMKSKKISEGVYSSVFGYAKFLLIWGLVLLADFILEFRFEYLYPVWLLIRTLQDSYKYQGVLLTMLFLTAAIGADVICYIFVPVQWLFFAASSYVWVQYVWHTDRGLCLSSVSLWLLFVYVEAALRMKDHKTLPFNMDLCRPFAAHCIGYPVVTLGYGIKTAATESIRRRTRGKVKKSNGFYHQLLQEALPIELQESKLTDDLNEDVTASSEQRAKKDTKLDDLSDSGSETSEVSGSTRSESNTVALAHYAADRGSGYPNPVSNSNQNNKSEYPKSSLIEEFDVKAEHEARELQRRTINDMNEESETTSNYSRGSKPTNKDPVPSKKLNSKRNKATNAAAAAAAGSASPVLQLPSATSLSNGVAVTANGDSSAMKSDYLISKMELDMKRLKADLQTSRNAENELRSQLQTKSSDERQKKLNLTQLQQDNDNLQNKLHNIVTSRQQDKQGLAVLEKKLEDEKKLREKSETQLASERKTKKQEEQVAARAVALANASRSGECVGDCKVKVEQLEEEGSQLRRDSTRKDEQIRQLKFENSEMARQCKEKHKDINPEVLLSAMAAMKLRIGELQSSLSAETKMKIDLFQALGDLKRQYEMQAQMIARKDMEIGGLRAHIAEALALVPSSMYADQSLVGGQYTTPRLGSPTSMAIGPPLQSYLPVQEMVYLQHQQQQQQHMSPPHPHNIIASPPRFSPTYSQVSEPGSPSSTPTSELGGSRPTPQAKDYLAGSPANH